MVRETSTKLKSFPYLEIMKLSFKEYLPKSFCEVPGFQKFDNTWRISVLTQSKKKKLPWVKIFKLIYVILEDA